MTIEQDEEQFCTCGAGHGSFEGHVDWCAWLKLEARLRAGYAAAELLTLPGLHKIRVSGEMMDRRQVAAALASPGEG